MTYFLPRVIIDRNITNWRSCIKLEKEFFDNNLSLGVDIEAIHRFEQMIARFKRETLKRIYSEIELKYCFSKKNPAPGLAARFAFKEAAFKALSPLGQKIYYPQVQIINSPSGAPQGRFISEELNNKFALKVTLSHGRTEAIAVVLALRLE